MTLSEYLTAYISEHGLSQREFAKICRVSNGYISMLMSGYNPKTQRPIKPSLEKLRAVAGGMGVSLQELLSSVEDVSLDISNEEIISALPRNIIPMPNKYKVPLIGAIACGEPIFADENFEGEVEVPEHIKADFALRCEGDSMINARIFDGDIVYIRQQQTVENGEIAAVLIDNEATLKRVRLFDDHIVLEPENPMYKPFVYWGEEMNDVRIIGKATHFTSVVK